jgi:excisionase family DNA binding protein
MRLAKLLTIKEVAALWRVDRSTVWRWIKLGRLRALRIGDKNAKGGTVRIDEAEMRRSAEKYFNREMGAQEHDPSMG